MRIMTAQKLAFYSADRKEKFVSAGNRVIEECPDWAAKDAMFQAAEKVGILTRLAEKASTKEEVKVQEEAPANAHEVAEEPVKVKRSSKK